jgi:hypothetical protein
MTSSRVRPPLRFQPFVGDLFASALLMSLVCALACAGAVDGDSGLSTLDEQEESIARYELRNLLDPYSVLTQARESGSDRCILGGIVEVDTVAPPTDYEIHYEECGLVEGNVAGISNQVVEANFDFDLGIANSNYRRRLSGFGDYQRDGELVTLSYEVENDGVLAEVEVVFDTVAEPHRVTGIVDFSSDDRGAHCELDDVRIVANDQVLDEACGF